MYQSAMSLSTSVKNRKNLYLIIDSLFAFVLKFLTEEKQYECEECHNSFRSKVALRRHQKYACNNANAIFSTLNQEFKGEQ